MIIEGWIENQASILLFEFPDFSKLLPVFVVCIAQSDYLFWWIVIIWLWRRHHFDIVIREISSFPVAQRPNPPSVLPLFLDSDHVAHVKSKVLLLLGGEGVPCNGSFFGHAAMML